MMRSILSAALLALALSSSSSTTFFAQAFNTHHYSAPRPTRLYSSRYQEQQQTTSDPNDWLEDFRLFTGEIVNPYDVLKVDRQAERREIRQQYLKMSKRYHPDAARQRDILPGKCNNEDDVREEWERIKFSYEILTDKRLRKKFDRHEVLADPQAAMQRAAMDTAGKAAAGLGKGIFAVGMGIFSMGAKAVTTGVSAGAKIVTESIDKKKEEDAAKAAEAAKAQLKKPKQQQLEEPSLEPIIVDEAIIQQQKLLEDDTAAATVKSSDGKSRRALELPMFFAGTTTAKNKRRF